MVLDKAKITLSIKKNNNNKYKAKIYGKFHHVEFLCNSITLSVYEYVTKDTAPKHNNITCEICSWENDRLLV